jgi:hypothetical protein
MALVEPEEVRDFVNDCGPDLVLQLPGGPAVAEEGTGEDGDPIGEAGKVVRPSGERDALIEAEESVTARVEPQVAEEEGGGLVLDHDRHVLQVAGELGGDGIERLGHQALELGTLHAMVRKPRGPVLSNGLRGG